MSNPPLLTALGVIWLLCAGVQLYYWLRLFLPLARWQPENRSPQEPVTVVVCTHEHTPQLESLLEELSSQDYADYEVVLVNDGPVESVSALVRQHASGRLREVVLQAADKQRPGKKEPLALGVRHAQNDWILLTDADCSVTRRWISSMMVEASADHRVVLGFGPFNPGPGLTNLIARFDNLVIALQYLGMAQDGSPYMGVGRNLLYHKSLFDRAIHHHLELASGDDDLFIQEIATGQNTAICLAPESVVLSSTERNLMSFLHQKRRHVSTGPEYAMSIKMHLALFAFSFIALWWGGLFLGILAGSLEIGIVALVVVVIQWVVTGIVARKLRVKGITPYFVPLSMLYTLFIVVFGYCMMIGPPRTWKRS